MLVKSLRNTRVETLQGKIEVKEGEVFECTKSVYNGLKTCYKNNFEFLSLFVVFKSKQEIKGIEYKKGEVLEVDFKKFNNFKSFYKNNFIFVDTSKLYEKYVGKTKKEEKTNDENKKDDIVEVKEEKTAENKEKDTKNEDIKENITKKV